MGGFFPGPTPPGPPQVDPAPTAQRTLNPAAQGGPVWRRLQQEKLRRRGPQAPQAPPGQQGKMGPKAPPPQFPGEGPGGITGHGIPPMPPFGRGPVLGGPGGGHGDFPPPGGWNGGRLPEWGPGMPQMSTPDPAMGQMVPRPSMPKPPAGPAGPYGGIMGGQGVDRGNVFGSKIYGGWGG